MDHIDKQILYILQDNAQISNQDLADQVNLSPSPCLRRVNNLREQGYIKKEVALLCPEKLGLQLTAFVFVSLHNHTTHTMALFEKQIKQLPNVNQCYLITGQSADYMLKVTAKDIDDFQHFLLKKLTTIKGVTNIQSSFVLQNIIEKTALPLSHITM